MPFTSGQVLHDNIIDGGGNDSFSFTPDQSMIVKVYASAYAKSDNKEAGKGDIALFVNNDSIAYAKMTWGPEEDTLRVAVSGMAYVEKKFQPL